MAQHHTASDAAPEVRLELPAGAARPTVYEVHGGEFLIGSVTGCDLRVPGTKLPPVLAVITRHSDGVRTHVRRKGEFAGATRRPKPMGYGLRALVDGSQSIRQA